jgi:hypothetical protein
MKNIGTRLLVLLVVTLLGTGICFAANGSGVADGSGPLHDITAGEPFMYSGTVVACVKDDGLLLAVSEEIEPVLIAGIGPKAYWEEIGVERPAKGDALTAEGYTVEIDGLIVNIATSITFVADDGVSTIVVLLRDEDGDPLW